jgi:hypothetical protein
MKVDNITFKALGRNIHSLCGAVEQLPDDLLPEDLLPFLKVEFNGEGVFFCS